MAFRSAVQSAGELVTVDAELAWVGRLVSRAVGGTSSPAPGEPTVRSLAPGEPTVRSLAPGEPTVRSLAPGEPTVRLRIEANTQEFPCGGLRPVTRGAYSDGLRTVLVNACGSGFDLQVMTGDPLDLTARYRPGYAVRATNRLLARRFGLLAGQVLVHYPVLWRAGWRGRVPLHACVLRTEDGTLLLAGPGGVGKSTMLLAALAAGGTATADNLCCADAIRCFGVAEPLRTDAAGAGGRRTSHGRVEVALNGREPVLEPDRIVVLERGPRTEISPVRPEDAARALVAGTYAAGELRRYWAFAATLALATGCGPAHPAVAEIAAGYAERVPCLRVRVGDGAAVSIAQLSGKAP